MAKAELDLANTLVKAPSRGVVTDLTTDVGRYAGTGSPVLTLIVIHDVWINAEFTENNLGHVEVGTPVEILFDVLPGRVFKGEVRSVGLGTSPGSDQPVGQPCRRSRTTATGCGSPSASRSSSASTLSRTTALQRNLRIGGQASVMAYSEGTSILKLLGKVYIRLASCLVVCLLR